MVFDLGEPKQTELWMSNVLIPLDVVWIRDNKVLRIDTGGPVEERTFLYRHS